MSVTSWDYIRENFQPADRLAVVIKNNERLIQRIATAEQIATRRFQAWLRYENAHGGNIYISMNPLKPDAHGRTKQDIAVVRHIYLDLDHGGFLSIARIASDTKLPKFSYILNTSIGKYQVVWRVEGFGISDVENLQRMLAIKHNADRAATDVTRVLRIPGFYNHKYGLPYQVHAWRISDPVYCPSDFSIEPQLRVVPKPQTLDSKTPKGIVSQSERDWAETLRRLDQGEDPAAIQSWLEQKRQDKPNPAYYAARTVERALQERENRKLMDTDFDFSR
jgi:hypothetical protein